MTSTSDPAFAHRTRTNVRADLRVCPHGMHHPYPDRPDYPHSCDGCWCEGLRDRRLYGWQPDTSPALYTETDANPTEDPS